MGDHKFVYLPDDEGQTYVINLKGTGDGIFTLKSSDITDNEVQNTETFAEIPVTTNLEGELDIENSLLSLDRNGDGTTDVELQGVPNQTVTLPKITITTDNKTMHLGGPVPVLTATLSGFVNGDTAENSVTGSASCTTTATLESSAGSYPITCTIGTLVSDKYIFTDFAPGIFTIIPPTFLVPDISDKLVYQYDLIGKLLTTIPLDPSNSKAAGIAADDQKIYVVDKIAKKVFVYSTTGSLLSSFNLGIIDDSARGIAVKDDIIYVADKSKDQIVLYNQSGVVLSSFNLHSNNGDAQGLGIYNNTAMVVDEADKLVYLYDLITKTFQNSFKLNSSNGDPEGIVSDGAKYWVVDEEDKKIYEYNLAGIFTKTIPFSSSNGDAEGLELFYGGKIGR